MDAAAVDFGIVIIFIIILLVLATVFFFWFVFGISAVWSWVDSRQAKKWPTVTANIETCRFVKDNSGDCTVYRVEILYSYVVNGKSYKSDQIAFGYPGGLIEEEHRAIYEKISNANKVQAKYNPLKHEVSVLSSGPNNSSDLILGTTILVFVIGFIFLFVPSCGSNKALLREITVIESKTGQIGK